MWRALAILALSVGSAAAEPPCRPSARLTGERPLADEIGAVLRERGIAVVADAAESSASAGSDPAFTGAACRQVSAEVATGGHRIMVWITDDEGHRVERLTEDVPAAATAIESWARRDLLDPLLDARAAIPIGLPGAASAAQVERTAAPAAAPPHYRLAGGADVGVSGDGGLWTGVHAQACGRIGRICLGGLVRYAYDLERSGDTRRLGTERSGLEIGATVELPVHRGALAIAPGLGLALSSITAHNPIEEETEQVSAAYARAQLAAGYALARDWSLRAEVSLGFAPLARERLGEPDGIDRQLAASPKLLTWLGLGVAYGGP